MLNIAKCKICRKPFHSYGSKVCSDCVAQIDADFVVVRDYIYDHPGNKGVDELEEETGVSRPILLHLIKEGRLVLEGSGLGGEKDGLPQAQCEMCKKPLVAGRLCSACKSKLSSKLEASVSPAKPEKSIYKGPKMHVRRDD